MSLTCRDIAIRVLGEPKRIAGHEAMWLCPNHDDSDPSLQINFGKDKWMCGPCGKGGGPWALAAFLGHLHRSEKKQIGAWLREKMGEFELPSTIKPENLKYEPVASYHYTEVLRVVRMEAANPAGGKPYKTFVWQHYDIKNREWRKGGTAGPKPLYTNKLFKEAEQLATVYGFEGENKCELAGTLGLPAFSFKHLNEKEIEKLAGLDVILWPDYDAPGHDQCKQAAEMLTHSKKPRSVRIIRPPMDLPVGGDIIDAVNDCGYDKEKILTLAQQASDYPPPARPVGHRFTAVSPESAKWVWLNRIPAGALTVLDGDPGSSKSTLALEIAARITRGQGLPDNGIEYPPANVVVCSAEDSLSCTILPRVIAAGADRSRMIALPYAPSDSKEAYFARLPAQIDVLRKAVHQEQARLCIIDVLAAYIPVELSMSRDQDVRVALSPLAALAEETGCAFLALRHLNKSQAENILYRGGGSIGIIGAARCGLFIAPKEDDPNTRILSVYKNNMGALGKSWEFTLETGEYGAVRIHWEQESQQTPQSLLSSMRRNEEDRILYRSATEFLHDFLMDGPMPAKDCLDVGKKNGFNKNHLYGAKISLKVDSSRIGFGAGSTSYWELPKKQ